MRVSLFLRERLLLLLLLLCENTYIPCARVSCFLKKWINFLLCPKPPQKKNERRRRRRRRRKSRRKKGGEGKAKARDDRVCSRRRTESSSSSSSDLPRRAPKSGDRSSRKGIHRTFAQRRTQHTKSSREGGGCFLPEVRGASDGDDSNSETNQPRRVLERRVAVKHARKDTDTRARARILSALCSLFFSLSQKKGVFLSS